MADFSTIISYIISFILPLFVMGIGSVVNEREASTVLAYITFIVCTSFFYLKGYLPFWVLGGSVLLIAILLGFLFKGVVGSND